MATEGPQGNREGVRTRAVDNESRFPIIVEHLPIFISTADPEGNITYLNRTARRWLGIEGDAVQSLRLTAEALELARRATLHGHWRVVRDNFPGIAVGAVPHRTVMQTVVAHRDAAGEVEFYSTAAIDIGAERRLEAERSRLLAIMEETPDFVASADAKGRVFYLNRAARRQLGLGPEEPGERIRIKDIHPSWAYKLLLEEALPAAAQEGTWRGDTALRGRDGREIPVLQVIVAHKNGSRDVQYYSTIMRDITERKRMEERLHHRATRDALTGALNRGSFVEAVERELAQARVAGRRGSLLSLDLVKFKEVNDTFGHLAGDAVLKHVVAVARTKLRKRDVVGRLGGDEFAVLLPDAEPVAAVAIAQRLLARLKGEPPRFDGKSIPVRISIGITAFPDGAESAEMLLRRADRAMYDAKEAGGSGYSVSDGFKVG